MAVSNACKSRWTLSNYIFGELENSSFLKTLRGNPTFHLMPLTNSWVSLQKWVNEKKEEALAEKKDVKPEDPVPVPAPPPVAAQIEEESSEPPAKMPKLEPTALEPVPAALPVPELSPGKSPLCECSCSN